MITAILKINNIQLDADSLGEIFEGMGKQGDCPEEFIGRCNTPVQNGYTRILVEKKYAPAFELMKVTVAKPTLEALPMEEVPFEMGGKEEPILEGKLELKPVLYDKESFLTTCSEKIEITEKMTCEMARVEAFVAEEKTIGIEVIDIEYDGQKMFQVGTDKDGNPEYLGLHSGIPMYIEPVEVKE